MVNLDNVRYIKNAGTGQHSEIAFTGHPDFLLSVTEKYEALRERLRDLEVPMPGK